MAPVTPCPTAQSAPHHKRSRLGALALVLLCAILPPFAGAATANQAPQPSDEIIYTEVDEPAPFRLDYEDPDGPTPFTVTILEAPEHGELSPHSQPDPERPRRFLYTPEPGFSGYDEFRWQVSDGKGAVSEAAGYILVNRRPTAIDQDLLVEMDGAASIELAYSDDGYPTNPPTFRIERAPENGALTESEPGVYAYTPEAGFAGADSFRWTVSDGPSRSDWGKVTIHVHEPAELVVRPPRIDLVESHGAGRASSSFEIENGGGGILAWTATPAEAWVSVSPAAGEADPATPATVAVEVDLTDLAPGPYDTSITVAAEGVEPFVLPIHLEIVELEGKNIGIEDMLKIRLRPEGGEGDAGELAWVHAPGEAPTVEVYLYPEIAVGRLELTTPDDLSDIGYLQFDLEAPAGSKVVPILEESRGGGENWRAEELIVYLDGSQRYHIPLEDFRYWDGGTPRPIDLSLVDRLNLKIAIPRAGEYGHPGDEERRVLLGDLRLTELSVDLAAALAVDSVAVSLDGTARQGAIPRPWEGITNFEDREELLYQLGFRVDRASALKVNDWESNDRMFPEEGVYDFGTVDATYRRFAPDVDHVPWIPTIPYLVWQVQDPDIPADGNSQVERPKYAFMPPSDDPQWQEMVEEYVRYHRDLGIGIRAFSILNEPDGEIFWQDSEESAHEFYALTAEAVKRVDPTIPVAGPSHTVLPDPELLRSFLDYCATNDAPVDYLSLHAYPGSSPGAATFRDAAAMIRNLLDDYGDRFAHTELMVNEWSLSLRETFEDRHRLPWAAAAVASSFKGMVDGGYDSALWFSLEAIAGDIYYPSGLFDFDSESARPVLYAFDLFNRLGSERVEAASSGEEHGVDTLAAIDPVTGVVRLAVWWSFPGDGWESGSTTVDVDLRLPSGYDYDWERHLVDHEHGNLMPGVGYVPPEPVAAGRVEGAEGQISFELPLYGVSLVTFRPAGRRSSDGPIEPGAGPERVVPRRVGSRLP